MSDLLQHYLTANTTGYLFEKLRSSPAVKKILGLTHEQYVDKYNFCVQHATKKEEDSIVSESEAAAVLIAVAMSPELSLGKFLAETLPYEGHWLGKMRHESMIRSGPKITRFNDEVAANVNKQQGADSLRSTVVTSRIEKKDD